MATVRPLVTVHNVEGGDRRGQVLMPSVFMSPIRPDLVRFVHTNMAKNNRQAYAVATNAGYQTSAESWGTGRAVSRIPRVPGGGTHRAGQGAFGNMCRGGGMFNPNKTWRRWHRKVNITQKRHAVAAAIAASGIPALVMARGHKVEKVPEVPLVLDDSLQTITKTKQMVKCLTAVGCDEDLSKAKKSKAIRAGRGKIRNRRYVVRRGPLVIYFEDQGLVRSLKNLPGVEMCQVDRLNLLKLAPGGTLGRLCVWTEGAFKRLQKLYGRHTGNGTAALKKGYHLPRPIMTNPDLGRIINSDEIQTALNPMKVAPKCRSMHKNPLKNKYVLARLNPIAMKKKVSN
eukprot:GHVT01079343.1.p1 GENE.GHVT01079343.1~~GHVT01079343.1.p1  ORF type:complete len:342 (+),score=33.80 GHVT01079343.1:173-1198(+)